MIIRRLTGWPTRDWMSPFEELGLLRRQFGRLFDEMLAGAQREPMAGIFPLTNVSEDADNYYVRAELPGIGADELDISVAGNTLTLSGERKLEADAENAKYHRREREAGKFNRVITLPDQFQMDKVDARTTDGVLSVVLPKEEKSKPRQISVKTS